MTKNILIFLASVVLLVLFLSYAIDRAIYQMDLEDAAINHQVLESAK